MKKKNLMFIAAFATIFVLASSLEAVYASTEIDNKQYLSDADLPDFLLRLSEYLSNGNATELARIRKVMLEQERIKQERIKSTNGAVLHSPLADGFELNWQEQDLFEFMDSVDFHTEEYMYDIYNNIIAHTADWDSLPGNSDGSCALLETYGWNQDTSHPLGGESFIGGPTTGWAEGDIYIRAKKGPNSGNVPPWLNYVIVYAGTGSSYNYVGYEQVHTSSLTEIYVGTTYYAFDHIAVCCWTPP